MRIRHRRIYAMRQFREIGFEDHTAVGIDWRSPDEAAMENEEAAMEHATTDEDAGMLARCQPGILGALLRFILPPVTSQSRLKVANYRLVCLAHQAGIEGVADQSITQLAKRLGITKAALSHWNVKVCDELGSFKTRQGKSPEARESYRQSAIRSHAARGHALKQGVQGTSTGLQGVRLAIIPKADCDALSTASRGKAGLSGKR